MFRLRENASKGPYFLQPLQGTTPVHVCADTLCPVGSGVALSLSLARKSSGRHLKGAPFSPLQLSVQLQP